MLSQVITVSRNSIDILSQGADLNTGLTIDVLESSDLALGIIQCDLLVFNGVGAVLNDFISFNNSSCNFLKIKIERLCSFDLVDGLS